jgi:hypothetical protein
MRVYTHGKKRGEMQLLSSELRLLEKADDLLNDIAKYRSDELAIIVVEITGRLGVVIEELGGRKSEVESE